MISKSGLSMKKVLRFEQLRVRKFFSFTSGDWTNLIKYIFGGHSGPEKAWDWFFNSNYVFSDEFPINSRLTRTAFVA